MAGRSSRTLRSERGAEVTARPPVGGRLSELVGGTPMVRLRRVVEGGDHNGPQPDEFYDALGEFLDALPPIEAQTHRSA